MTPGSRSQTLWLHVAAWVVFAALAVMLRGVRWDENLDHAQILAGWFTYPEGHPRLRYVHGVFSLQTWSSTAILLLTQSDLALCAFRNWIFLLATTLPPFLLGATLGRSPWAGHAAAALILLGIHTQFDNQYPLFTWPGQFSNGHAGTAVALLIVWSFACDRRRTGFFLLGLMPGIHLGQFAAPFALGLAALVIPSAVERRADWKSATAKELGWLMAGVAICAGFAAWQRANALPAPTTGPYAVAGDVHAIWANFTAHYDGHRKIVPGNHHIGMALACIVSVLGWWRTRNTAGWRSPWLWVSAYCIGTACLVWGIMAVHAAMGIDTPFLLLSWMPYRIANHAAILLVPMIVGMLMDRSAYPDETHDRPGIQGTWAVSFAVAFVIVTPLFAYFPGGAVYTRYLSEFEPVLFGLTGAACAHWFSLGAFTQRGKRSAVVLGAIAILLLGLFHRFGAACLAAGIVAYAIAEVFRNPLKGISSFFPTGVLAGLVAVALLLAVLQEHARYENLPKPAFHDEARLLLDWRGDSQAVVVTEPGAWSPQAKLHHPVLLDMDLLSHIMYMPELGPVICQLYRDVYGIHYDVPPASRPSWQEIWAARSRDEWTRLAGQYDFEYVVAPTAVRLDLDVLLLREDYTLYAVPR